MKPHSSSETAAHDTAGPYKTTGPLGALSFVSVEFFFCIFSSIHVFKVWERGSCEAKAINTPTAPTYVLSLTTPVPSDTHMCTRPRADTCVGKLWVAGACDGKYINCTDNSYTLAGRFPFLKGNRSLSF